MRWPAQVRRQYQTGVSVFTNCGESVAVQIYGNFTREGAPFKSHCNGFFYINSEPPVWKPSWCSRHWLLKVLLTHLGEELTVVMQRRLQIGHTGLDVVYNSRDQLCMPEREVVPGLSLEEPLPAQGATMRLSSVYAHTGGGQRGSRLSKQRHDCELQSGAVWWEDLCAIPCQRLLISRRSRQGWCCLPRLQLQACAPVERAGMRWSLSAGIQTDGLAGTGPGGSRVSWTQVFQGNDFESTLKVRLAGSWWPLVGSTFFCYRADCSTECLFISSRCC